MWIFESQKKDILFIYLPGLLVLSLLPFIQGYHVFTAIISFIIFNFIDAGHVYSTVWRTIFDKEEIKRSKRYILTPIILSVLIGFWLYFKIPYFWSFVGYFTIYHNLRQGFGIMKWYEKKNEIFHKHSNFVFYLLTYLPVIMFHFRGNNFGLMYYVDQGAFMYTNHHPFHFFSFNFPNIFMLIFTIIYVFSLLYWIACEYRLYHLFNKVEYNRVFFMIYFFFIYFYAFLLSNNFFEMAALLVVSHGIPYFFMMKYSLIKTRPLRFTIKKALILILITAIIGGLINFAGEELIKNGFDYVNSPKLLLLEYVIIFVYVIPVLCHFIWDASIWRGNHPDAKLIYNKDKVYNDKK